MIAYVGQYGYIFSMNITNTEPLGDLLEQIGSMLGVGARDDGRYYLSDMGQADGNLWARYKSFAYQGTFSDEDAREEARKGAFFGIDITDTTHTDNSYIRYLSFERKTPPSGYNPPYYNRIRDFIGYNPTAPDGVHIAGTQGIGADMSLEVLPEMPFNVTLRDLIERYSSLTTFRWVLIDPFGFVRELGSGTYTRDGILSYLYDGGTKISVNITDDFKNKGYNQYNAIPSPNRPINQAKWILGLAGWESKTSKIILNPSIFNENSVNTCPVRIAGFSPNMTIGTAYQGKTTLKEILYNNAGAIQCCSNDFLFMGFTVTNLGSSVFNMGKLRLLLITNVSSLRPYQTKIAVYNRDIFDSTLSINGQTGSGGGFGTAWANNMLFVRTTNLWSIAPQGFFAIAYVESASNIQLLTPYVQIGLTNMGVTVDSIEDDIKANLPELKPVDNTWSTQIQ